MSRRHLAMLLLLSAVWGTSFMFIKFAVRDLEPATAVLGRVLLAALALATLVPLATSLRRACEELRSCALPMLFVGVANSTLPFWLLFWAETRIDSGLAAIIQASAPLFTALLALAFVPSERVSVARLLGFLAGFAGVALLVGAAPEGSVLAGLAVIGTALCYAVASLYTARRLADVSPLVVTLGTMIGATLVALPPGLAQLPDEVPGWKAIASVVALGLGGSALAYLLYFAIIGGAGASRAILVTYLVPPMALGWGAVFLDESVGLSDVGGLVLILGGVALGTGALRLPVSFRT